ncbi:MAG: hypothetical protein HOL08_18725, partial [Opitutae bacterium]|nr:hypothetical protein [Opitutae bacterium]
MMRIFAKASFLLLTVLILPAQEQNRYSPYTIDVYMGDFGFVPLRTEVEPKISSDDNKLLIQVKKLAVTEQPAAIQLLTNKLQGDPDCNAVF